MDREDLNMICVALERILEDAPLEEIDAAGGVGDAAQSLWQTLEDNGYTRLCCREAEGGAGATLADALSLLKSAGRFALPLPLGETIVSGALLSEAGMAIPVGPVGVMTEAGQLSFVGMCNRAVRLEDGHLTLLAISEAACQEISQSEDRLGNVDPSLCQVLDKAPAPTWCDAGAWQAIGAATRAASMAGAMQAILDLTLQYTQDREQFGRPLSKFQAIQHHLSDIAGETAACSAAVDLMADEIGADPDIADCAQAGIAVAKIRCGEAATRVAAASHQAHGAMGFTREYALGRFTRRLWQWQDEYGSAQEWAIRMGRSAVASSLKGLWPHISR